MELDCDNLRAIAEEVRQVYLGTSANAMERYMFNASGLSTEPTLRHTAEQERESGRITRYGWIKPEETCEAVNVALGASGDVALLDYQWESVMDLSGARFSLIPNNVWLLATKRDVLEGKLDDEVRAEQKKQRPSRLRRMFSGSGASKTTQTMKLPDTKQWRRDAIVHDYNASLDRTIARVLKNLETGVPVPYQQPITGMEYVEVMRSSRDHMVLAWTLE
ncbi:MAG: hypothetical protein ABIA93_06035 [Candidatus Woesearchaeota archaeon]